MEFNLRVWALGFTSIAIGALAMLALSLSLARGNRQLRVALVLTYPSAICALATHGPFALLVLRESAGLSWPFELRWPSIAVGVSLIGLLWLSVMILFDDVRLTLLRLAPAALLATISFGSVLTGNTDLVGIALSRVLEAAPGGRTASAYLSEKIWRRAGMEADAYWPLTKTGIERGGGFVSATLRDFARFGLFIAKGDAGPAGAVPPCWIDKARAPVFAPTDKGSGYGLGWWVRQDGATKPWAPTASP